MLVCGKAAARVNFVGNVNMDWVSDDVQEPPSTLRGMEGAPGLRGRCTQEYAGVKVHGVCHVSETEQEVCARSTRSMSTDETR